MHSNLRVYIVGGPYQGKYAQIISMGSSTILCRIEGHTSFPIQLDAQCVQLQQVDDGTQHDSLNAALERVRKERTGWWWWTQKEASTCVLWRTWQRERQSIIHAIHSLKEALQQGSTPESGWYERCREYLPIRPIDDAQRAIGLKRMGQVGHDQKTQGSVAGLPMRRGERYAYRNAQVQQRKDALRLAQTHIQQETGHSLSVDMMALWMCMHTSTDAEHSLWRAYLNLELVGLFTHLNTIVHDMTSPNHSPLKPMSSEFCALVRNVERRQLIGAWFPTPYHAHNEIVSTSLGNERTHFNHVAPTLGKWLVLQLAHALDHHVHGDFAPTHIRNVGLLREMFDDYQAILNMTLSDALPLEQVCTLQRSLKTLDAQGVPMPHTPPTRELNAIALVLSAGDLSMLEGYKCQALRLLEAGEPYEALALARDCWSYAEEFPKLKHIACEIGDRAYTQLGHNVYAKRCMD